MELNPNLDLSNTSYYEWKAAEQRAHRKIINDKYRAANKENILEKQKEYRKQNKEKVALAQKTRTQRHKQKAVEYLGGHCAHCKGVFPLAVYDFHHVNPNEKEGLLSKILWYSWTKIQIELDKCILLCANCHRIEHNKNKDSNDY